MFRTKNKKGFTLIELLVVISIIALLLSILMPSLQKVKEQAKRTLCSSNLHQAYIALNLYAHDWEGKYPSHDDPPAPYNYWGGGQQHPFTAFCLTFRPHLSGGPDWYSEFYQSYLKEYKMLFCPALKGKRAQEDWDNWGIITYSYFGDFKGNSVWWDLKEKEKMPKKTSDSGSWNLMADMIYYDQNGAFGRANHYQGGAFVDFERGDYGLNRLRNGGDVSWDTIPIDPRNVIVSEGLKYYASTYAWFW